MPKKEESTTVGKTAETSQPKPMGEVIQIDYEFLPKTVI
jgi:hypothetical protein